jgi:peptidoglycan/LPS O-acetylase OafA/YrhL
MESKERLSQIPDSSPSLSARILNRFRRVTSSGSFISEIDGLRFIAIGTVVLFHLAVGLAIKAPGIFAMPESGNWLAAVARHGFHGVELFFIISGFILAYPFASHFLLDKRRVALKQYFFRRVTRLEPPYFICMIVLYLVLVLVKGENAGVLLPHLGASLLYIHNVVFGTESLINNVAWSLEIEIQFYLLVPLLSRLFAIRNVMWRRSVIVGLGIVSIICAGMFLPPEHRLHNSIFRFLQFFLIGFLLADIYLVDWKEKPLLHWRWDIVSLLGWPLLFVVWNYAGEMHTVFPISQTPLVPAFVFPASALFLYVAVFRGPLTNRVMTNPWITTIGGMCYTIYLFHNQVLSLLIWMTKGLVFTSDYTVNVLMQFVIISPPLLAATGLYFLLIEKPCMQKDWPIRLHGRVRHFLSGRSRTSIDL